MTEERFLPAKDPSGDSGRTIPPVEGAWSLMRKKLDTRLPVTSPRVYSKAAWWSGAAAAVIATTAILVFQVSRTAHRPLHPDPAGNNAPQETARINTLQAPAAALEKANTPEKNQRPIKDSIAITDAAPAALRDPAAIPDPAGKTPTISPEKINRLLQPEMGLSSGSSRKEWAATNHWRKVHEGSEAGSTAGTQSAGEQSGETQPAGKQPAVKPPAHTRSILHIERSTHSPFSQVADSLLRTSALKKQWATTPAITREKKKSLSGKQLRMAAGISAGKAFPIDGQDAYAYSSSGEKSGLSDYIPHVYFRYYPRKNNYIQAELAIHSPQYTHSPFVDSNLMGTSTLPGWRSDPEYFTVALKKLYYNDLGLSFHQRVFKELWLGAGIQFSHLTDAVAEKDTMVFTSRGGGRDTVIGSQKIALVDWGEYDEIPKNDWRITLQAEYSWRRWMLSVVFKEAIHAYTDFFPVSYMDHYRNSSLSVYLSYDLWERRRRGQPLYR